MTVGSQVKSCFASIKSAKATIDLLANKTQNSQAKEDLKNASKLIEQVKKDLQKQMIYISHEEPQYK